MPDLNGPVSPWRHPPVEGAAFCFCRARLVAGFLAEPIRCATPKPWPPSVPVVAKRCRWLKTSVVDGLQVMCCKSAMAGFFLRGRSGDGPRVVRWWSDPAPTIGGGRPEERRRGWPDGGVVSRAIIWGCASSVLGTIVRRPRHRRNISAGGTIKSAVPRL